MFKHNEPQPSQSKKKEEKTKRERPPTSSKGFNTFLPPASFSFWNLSTLVLIRAAITPKWSSAIVFAAFESVWDELDLTSSRDET